MSQKWLTLMQVALKHHKSINGYLELLFAKNRDLSVSEHSRMQNLGFRQKESNSRTRCCWLYNTHQWDASSGSAPSAWDQGVSNGLHQRKIPFVGTVCDGARQRAELSRAQYLVVHVVQVQGLPKGRFHFLLHVLVAHGSHKRDNPARRENPSSAQRHAWKCNQITLKTHWNGLLPSSSK